MNQVVSGRRRLTRGAVLALGLPSLLLGAAACSSKPVPYQRPTSAASSPASSAPNASSSTSSTPASSTPAAAPSVVPTGSQSPLAAASGQLTGTQLQTVLLPQSYFPAGYTVSASSAVSSGGKVETAPAAHPFATMTCAYFLEHLGNTGFGESAIASDSFVGPGSTQGFDQVVYQFPVTSQAPAFLSGARSLASRCKSFTASDDGTTGTFAMTAAAAPAVAGHPSLDIEEIGTLNGGKVTLDTLFTASGTDVFAVAALGLGGAPPSAPARSSLNYALMKRQAAAAVLG
jgi:hypothetical protein